MRVSDAVTVTHPYPPASGEGSEVQGGAHERGWALATTRRAMHRAILRGVGFLLLVTAGAVLLVPATEPHRWWVLPLHLLLVAATVAAAEERLPVPVLTGGILVVLPIDWAVDGPDETALTLATIWVLHVTQFLPTVLDRSRPSRILSVVAVGLPLAMALVRPEWTGRIAVPFGVAGLALRWAGLRVVPLLESYVARIDADLDASWEAEREVLVATSVSRELSEHSRALHDTAVNTLAAVAAGGAATSDVALVRARCARDVERLEALLDGLDAEPDLRLAPVARELGLELTREGLVDDELQRVATRLPQEVVRALAGAAREALLNVAKHAGTGRATVEVAGGADGLTIRIRDHGPGFDGEVLPDRGLARSVLARGEGTVRTSVESRPGVGTEVVLEYVPPSGSGQQAAGHDAPLRTRTELARVLARACWLWCVASACIGLAIEVIPRPYPNPTYGMLAVTTAASGLALWAVRGGRPLPPSLTALTVACVPLAYTLGAARGDWGRVDGTAWQAIGVTALFVVLLVHGRTRAPFVLGLGAMVVAAVVVTVTLADDPRAAAFIPVGTAPPLAVAAAWVRFRSLLEEVGARSAARYEVAQRARAERAARDEAARAYLRWRIAGVTSSLALLRDLATGALDPDEPATREACGQEEAFLRQVIQLDPGLFRLGDHLARALAVARGRGVRLVIRSGGRDVDTADTAARLGALVMAVVDGASAQDEVTVSLFVSNDGLRFSILGPQGVVRRAASGWDPPAGWLVATSTHAAVALVELSERGGASLPMPDDGAGVGAGHTRGSRSKRPQARNANRPMKTRSPAR